MKLCAKAKPVKIRITSGGQEHTSLESLKHNFDIEDVRQLLDGRLSRWLKQQGENELAEYIGLLKPKDLDTSKGIIDLMTLFFPEEVKRNKVKNVLALMELWLKSKQYRKNGVHLFFYIAEEQRDAETVLYLYKHREELECPVTEWLYNLALTIDDFRGSFKSIEKGNPEVLYIIGRMLFEGYKFYTSSDYAKNPEAGIDLIRKSAKLGFKEAKNYISEYDKNNTTVKREQVESNEWMITDYDIDRFLKSIDLLGYAAERNGYKYARHNSGAIKEIDRYKKMKATALCKASLYIKGLLFWWTDDYKTSKLLFNESGFNFPKFEGHSLSGLSFQQQLQVIKKWLIDYYGQIRK